MNIHLSEKPVPKRIIWRCVPSPQSNRSWSPPRWMAIELTLRPTVGRDAAVPKKVIRIIESGCSRSGYSTHQTRI